MTLVGATETIPLLGPTGIVVSGEVNASTQEASAAINSFTPAVNELGQDLLKLVGLNALPGSEVQPGPPQTVRQQP